MVDFVDERTSTVSPEELIKKLILEKRQFVSDSIEAYNRQDFKGYGVEVYEIRCRLLSLFDEVSSSLKDEFGDGEVLLMREEIKVGDISDLVEAFDFINDWLHKKKLTKIFKNDVIL